MVAASIRYNNPGAQWDGPIAKKWGSAQHVVLADGQANHIAIFDSNVHGAAAEFDLWRNRYCNLTLQGAIAKWCGGNSPAAYMTFLETKTGMKASDIVTPALLASERGLALMKAQAQWEAGQAYPMSDAEWRQAQSAVFKGGSITGPVVAGGGVTGGTVIAAQQANAAGYHWGAVVGILAVGLIIAAVVYIILLKSKQVGPQPLPVPTPSPGPIPARGPIPSVLGGGAQA